MCAKSICNGTALLINSVNHDCCVFWEATASALSSCREGVISCVVTLTDQSNLQELQSEKEHLQQDAELSNGKWKAAQDEVIDLRKHLKVSMPRILFPTFFHWYWFCTMMAIKPSYARCDIAEQRDSLCMM